jgi:predicted TIM-barrel fold metal-dependent hydrolase
MSSASLSGALLVETWDGRNRAVLDDVLRRERGKFLVAVCYRRESSGDLLKIVHKPQLTAVRISTEDMSHDGTLCEQLSQRNKVLLVHAELGIGPLCREITRLAGTFPQLGIYVPHLAWPQANGKPDSDWDAAVRDLSALPNLTIGISAIAHFSREPFPHNDVRHLALGLISQFPPPRLVIGSDYPLCARERYADYVDLARNWVASIHPDWLGDNFYE